MASSRCITLCSPARTFLNLSRPSQATLEFLIPPAARTVQRANTQRRYLTNSQNSALSNGATRPGTTRVHDRTSTIRHAPTASFATTLSHQATRAIFNHQKDEDGNEMMLEITPRAAKRLSSVMAKDSNPYLGLRIQVESGGCHGFQYLFKLVTVPSTLPSADTASEPTSADAPEPTVSVDDTIFAFTPEDTSAGEVAGAEELTLPKIILDGPSLELLKGSKLDYTQELIGSQFKIDNPLATSSCGCGTSFDIKI